MEPPITQINLPAPAKLNLFLHILSQRADGYHNLQTAFQFLDYKDELQFQLRDDQNINLNILDSRPHSEQNKSQLSPLPIKQNLVIRAATLLQQQTNTSYGIDIVLHKRIPIGAGLGGGSSDAATTLLALNQLWQLKLPLSELLKLALSLGADVPFFVYGTAAFAEGIGEQFQPISPSENWYVVIIPPCTTPTKEIYSAPELTRSTPPITIKDFLNGCGHNDFEKVVCHRYPEIAAAFDWLNQFAKAKLTGSGSCVFAAFDKEQQAIEVAKQIPAPLIGFIAKGLNRSPLSTAVDFYWGVAKR